MSKLGILDFQPCSANRAPPKATSSTKSALTFSLTILVNFLCICCRFVIEAQSHAGASVARAEFQGVDGRPRSDVTAEAWCSRLAAAGATRHADLRGVAQS